MATTVELVHEIRCSPERYWQCFLDDALGAELFTRDLGFPIYRVLERIERPDGLERRVEIAPRLSMPGKVRAVLGDRFRYIEHGVFDGSSYRFELLPPAGIPSGRASASGVMRAAPTAAGWTWRTLELRCEVRMLGVGGMLERFAVQAATQTYTAHATALSARLRNA